LTQSFFAKEALLGKESINLSVRARTAVKVLVMGRNVFTHVSEAIASLWVPSEPAAAWRMFSIVLAR